MYYKNLKIQYKKETKVLKGYSTISHSESILSPGFGKTKALAFNNALFQMARDYKKITDQLLEIKELLNVFES